MKKLISCIICASVIAMGTMAYADYDRDSNSYSVEEGNKYSTVLITSDISSGSALSKEDIYYINQAESGFDTAVNFLLKENPPSGSYLVKKGFADGSAPDTEKFTIGTATVTDGDTEMIYLPLQATGTVAFTINGIDIEELKKFKSIKLLGAFEENGEYKELLYPIEDIGLNLDGFTGGSISFGIQINNFPLEYENTVSLYLSEDELPVQSEEEQ